MEQAHLVLELNKKFPQLPVTVYLRNKEIDEYLTKTAGVKKVVHGTYDEHDTISTLAAEHNIVINVGSSWDEGLSEAIVAGLKQQPAGTTKLIHMSGTGNFVDQRWTDGSHHAESKTWSVSSIPYPFQFIVTN